jgi:hypothetical protein
MADALSAAAGDYRSPTQSRSDDPVARYGRAAAMMLAATLLRPAEIGIAGGPHPVKGLSDHLPSKGSATIGLG